EDAINAGRKKVIGMMLLADRHDVISHYAEKSDGYEAVAQYTIGKFKPSLAYLRTDVKNDTNVSFDDTLTEYVSIGAWYNFTDNFNAYVDYKVNLLDDGAVSGTSKLGQNTDDVVGVALQYNF
uniref:porin n=1 Tax=Aeromonas allosaccharophila TaxID=656 RepID=UPI002B467FB9